MWISRQIFLYVFLLVGVSSITWSNTEEKNTHGLSFDVLKAPIGLYQFSYQNKLREDLFLTVPFEIDLYAADILPPHVKSVVRTVGWFVLPEFGIHTGLGVKVAKHGWYLHPLVKFGYVQFRVREDVPTTKGLLLQPTFNVGYLHFFSFGALFDVSFGTSVSLFFFERGFDYQWLPNVSILIGYGW